MDYIVPTIIFVPFYMFSYKVPPFHNSHCSNIASGQLRRYIIGYHDDLEISFSQKINLYIYNMGLKKKILLLHQMIISIMMIEKLF